MTTPAVAHPFATAPAPVVTARWLATVQVVAFSACALLSLVWVTAALAASGDWRELGIVISVCVTGLFVFGALVVGVPLSLLRCGRPAARVALIVGEIVLALPMLFLFPTVVGGVGAESLVTVLVLGNGACIVGVIASLARREAREWSSWTPVAVWRR